MVNKAKMKRVMPKQFTPTRANLAQVGGTPLELPNHSRGKAPEADRGLVNKEYVDDQNLWKVNGTGCTELKTPDGVNLQDNFLYFDTAKKVGLVGVGGDLGVGLEPG